MLARSGRMLTVDQFLRVHDGVEGRYELVDGVVYAMAGGSVAHATASVNVLASLYSQLRGSGCRPFNWDMGLIINDDTLRYPDVAVYCDARDLDRDRLETRGFSHPKLVVEVLSPSTMRQDRSEKVTEYKTLASVSAIVLVDPVDRTFELHERVAPNEWRHVLLPPGSDLTLRDPAVVLTAAEVFD